jgi:hypothetical protein
MPYFFRLKDYEEKKTKWMKNFLFALHDFSYGCQKVKKNENEKISFVFIYQMENIDEHELHKFEYKNEIGIPKENILVDIATIYYTGEQVDKMYKNFENYCENYELSDDDELYYETYNPNNYNLILLKDYLDSICSFYVNLTNLYIHITCETNIDSIIKNGIFPENEILSKDRIGNRVDFDEESDNKETDNEETDNSKRKYGNVDDSNKKKQKVFYKYLKYKLKYSRLKNKLFSEN